MNYAEALAWIDQHVNLEATKSPGRHRPPTLDRMHELMTLMAEPQRQYPVIHLTGTNGKTSTARLISRLLEVAGLTVGTYTSPDLVRINERLAWNLEPIDDDAFAEVVSAVADLVPLLSAEPSRFEILTAAAFRWFADIAVQVAVVEVGLLGTWDSTNVADGAVAVITNVGPDHLDYASTLEGIATEKAGIVKEGATLVLGEIDAAYDAIFSRTPAGAVWRRGEDYACTANDVAHGGRVVSFRTPAARYDNLYLSLHGAYQGDNAATALAAAEAFLGQPLATDIVEEAFATATSPGRLEVVGRSPLVVLDGAHNPHGAAALADTLVEEFGDADPWTLVLGVLSPHEPGDLLGALQTIRIGLVVACAPDPSPRALSPDVIAKAAEDEGLPVEVAPSVAAAVGMAREAAGQSGRVLVTGSLHTVGRARAALVP